MGKKMSKNNFNRELRQVNLILIFICIYCLVSIGLPFAFKYNIFKSTAYSNLTNNEWIGFLGSYVGGILGGLGTLISVYYTVKTSVDMQKEENERRNAEISEEHKRRDLEIQAENERKERDERVKFTGEIATLVGEYLTSITNYHFMNVEIERKEKEIADSDKKLYDLKMQENEIYGTLKNNSSGQYDDTTELKLMQLRNEFDREYRHYNQLLSERSYKLTIGNRSKAIECLHILEAKLIDIEEGKNLLMAIKEFHNHNSLEEHNPPKNGDPFYWIKEFNEKVIEQYRIFQKEFINNKQIH